MEKQAVSHIFGRNTKQSNPYGGNLVVFSKTTRTSTVLPSNSTFQEFTQINIICNNVIPVSDFQCCVIFQSASKVIYLSPMLISICLLPIWSHVPWDTKSLRHNQRVCEPPRKMPRATTKTQATKISTSKHVYKSFILKQFRFTEELQR